MFWEGIFVFPTEILQVPRSMLAQTRQSSITVQHITSTPEQVTDLNCGVASNSCQGCIKTIKRAETMPQGNLTMGSSFKKTNSEGHIVKYAMCKSPGNDKNQDIITSLVTWASGAY